ncbi:phosphorylcholine transferase LicD [Dysgonomonas sp. 511]|uniref:LicD family protein n=1 Tax=Dysgonomonas sp. 511 TaxID=2302930 RepID=UPI0013D657AF|nr:LicD family protein [Dysgonomonas sp. 511]NDV77461.1 LicD family protein [Dysgonomonas sp. 511]
MEKEDLRAIYNPEGSELRKLQYQMLDILITVTNICDKHNIPYWLSGGTLLGSIRHGGFIPWDDDIDIELLRPDYLKLLKILPEELPPHLYLQTPREKSYRFLFSKVRDCNTIIRSEEEDMATYKVKGIYIDLFPLERGYTGYKKVVDLFYGRAFRRLKRGRAFQSFQYFFEYITSLFLFPIGYILLWIGRGISVVTKPDNVIYNYGSNFYFDRKMEDLLPVSKVTFEGHQFSAPHAVDRYLRKQYGDYMVIPPKDKRAIHFTDVEYL